MLEFYRESNLSSLSRPINIHGLVVLWWCRRMKRPWWCVGGGFFVCFFFLTFLLFWPEYTTRWQTVSTVALRGSLHTDHLFPRAAMYFCSSSAARHCQAPCAGWSFDSKHRSGSVWIATFHWSKSRSNPQYSHYESFKISWSANKRGFLCPPDNVSFTWDTSRPWVISWCLDFGCFCFVLFQCDDGECGPIQRAGILPSPQTAEHQEPGQVVPHLER